MTFSPPSSPSDNLVTSHRLKPHEMPLVSLERLRMLQTFVEFFDAIHHVER